MKILQTGVVKLHTCGLYEISGFAFDCEGGPIDFPFLDADTLHELTYVSRIEVVACDCEVKP